LSEKKFMYADLRLWSFVASMEGFWFEATFFGDQRP